MIDVLVTILQVLTPLLVAGTTGFCAILVAKIGKVQKDTKSVNEKVDKVQNDIITNHGSKNLGDAIDRLTDKVSSIAEGQDDLMLNIRSLRSRDESLEARLNSVEHSKKRIYQHLGLAPKTEPITLITTAKKAFFKRKRR